MSTASVTPPARLVRALHASTTTRALVAVGLFCVLSYLSGSPARDAASVFVFALLVVFLLQIRTARRASRPRPATPDGTDA